jgi:uncharacterized protein YjbI with pentapeptide repeats
VSGHTACLAHLANPDRDAYLAELSPGADIDHRGTPFTHELLNQLLAALCDPSVGKPHLGDARFDGAFFSGDARFDGAFFSGDARFDRASFSGDAWFNRASFSGAAVFGEAIFTGCAVFSGASFSGGAGFGEASFSNAYFVKASFPADAGFSEVMFTGRLLFHEARFEVVSYLGPLVGGELVELDRAVFQQPVTIDIAARQVSCARTKWAATATLHLRYAELDLSDAVFEYPVVVAARPDHFLRYTGDPLPETGMSGQDPGVRLRSVGGVDAAHLALQDIDLSNCTFAGAVHLDQLKVDGWCTFAITPASWCWRFPWRWSRRNTLLEEHHWRVRTARHLTRARGWTKPPEGEHSSCARLHCRRCIGSCANRWRTARMSRTLPTSTTANARCAATTPLGPGVNGRC